jgi:hypothetical protein
MSCLSTWHLIHLLPFLLPTAVLLLNYSAAAVTQALYVLSDDSVTDAASSSSGGAFGFLADGFEAFLKVWLAAWQQHHYQQQEQQQQQQQNVSYRTTAAIYLQAV